MARCGLGELSCCTKSPGTRLALLGGMRDKTHKIIALCALSGAMLLGVGIGVAEVHVSKIEREALAAFEAEQAPIVLTGTIPAEAVTAVPHIIETTVTREEFTAARASALAAAQRTL